MLRFSFISKNLRFYSIKHATKGPVKYTSTINLPKTRFPARLSAAKRLELERSLVETTFANAYMYQQEHNKDPQYILHDGPPYANGDLHIGHAVNKILKDITIRNQIAHGRKVHFMPGWDCHGLPIELKALASTGKKTGVEDPITVRKKSRRFALEAIERQKSEFRSWGILSNWDEKGGLYFTFNPDFICNQLKLFYNMYAKGLVYRDLKPVYWSPSSRTALAEAELEYDNNFVSPSVYTRFAIDTLPSSFKCENGQKLFAIIWTTTPWTLPSNQAICFNSNLEYSIVQLNASYGKDLYLIATKLIDEFVKTTGIDCEVKNNIAGADLIGCTYRHSLYPDAPSLPFFDATHVQDTKGTGLVHTAPAHGPDDFLICLAKNIPIKSLIDEDGVYNLDAPNFLRGKNVLKEGNKIVMEHLKDDIIYADVFTHSYPLDWRTKEPIILRASEQWFINTSLLKEKAVDEISNVKIYPRVNAEASRNTLRTQVMKRPYWCISRQRAWGVPIPVFYNSTSKEVICNEAILSHICDLVTAEGGIDFWWSKSVDELLPKSLLTNLNVDTKNIVKGLDIFDIWFDSGSTWSHALKDQQIADLYLEGYDQFTGWFQSSLLTSVAARESAPYKSIFVHGFTVDENGHKMSKSLGNVISPNDITKKFGVDTLRWWVASHGTQHMAITVSEKLLQQAADGISKIRLTLRFLNGVIGTKRGNDSQSKQHTSRLTYLNQYLLSKLVDFDQKINTLYASHEYNRVVANIQNFVANQMSSMYLHLIKDRLYCGSEAEIESIRFTMEKCYIILNKALWPIVPFLVEESWSYYDPKSAFYQQTFEPESTWKNDQIELIVETALEVKRLANQKSNFSKNSWLLAASVKCSNDGHFKMLQHLHQPHSNDNDANSDSELCEILQVQSVTLIKSCDPSSEVDVDLTEIEGTLCPRCRRYAVISANEICSRCCKVLETQK
ncbi:isoleucine--tRNA ligase, mitochondrial [Stomoxys calcitrans]|uniref:isoleucine--tRNA ligase, mitochondrial n=1 Tax=Stomoxys calcitrans TaxID=35570 RepID=UPI0027E21D73|nr:isoleucine--tRNA ligase, mitochondrial [Stomoxys calcitrans]